jgi:putative hemolysin
MEFDFMDSRTGPAALAARADGRWPIQPGDRHIVDQLIDERSIGLSSHFWWPAVKPLLLRFFHYAQAVRMVDAVSAMSGWDAFSHLSGLLALKVDVHGLENIPAAGGFILAPSHPTGIADGIAIFDALKGKRPDMAIFANRDAVRAAEGFRDMIIPVEWRENEKSHSKSRDTLEMTARAFAANKVVVLFPAGRIAYWNEDQLTERPWQTSVVALARRYNFPIVPANMTARNSGLFYFLSKYSTELRDITIFHEFLNKKGQPYSIVVGKPIDPSTLEGDIAEMTTKLQHHTVEVLREDPSAVFVAR